ncbi:MAG: carboxy terminal-processing peptidase [Ferruginibacter sp.]
MQKIAAFIMSKRIIPVVLAATLLGVLFTFRSVGSGLEDDPKEKHAKILRRVGLFLKEMHYSPQQLNDQFSKTVFTAFLKELDDDKNIFLKPDIEKMQRFESKIDDEIEGAPLESFYGIHEVYTKRFNETVVLYKKLLEHPFEFNTEETYEADSEKLGHPRNELEREERWMKRLKYATLSRMVDLIEDREKNKEKKDFIYKADSTLEREAREAVKKQMDRYFSTRKTRETVDEIFSKFINAITSSMDPHTNYFPPIDLRSFNESMSGRFFGIGAQLKEEDGKILIASLVSGGPAWKGGELKENDEIVKVGQGAQEPVDVTGYSVSDAVKLIRGSEKGSEVRLTVRKSDGSLKVIKLIRDNIKLEDTFAKSAIINGKKKIGYIYLPEFYADFERIDGARCARDVEKEIQKLKMEKVDGIIMDLRGNGGGSLYDVVQMVGFFIPSGPVCQVKGRGNTEKPNVLQDTDERLQYGGPLAVMVDGGSASASEIFAAAIQDYKRGVIIGSSSTYGKGTVQRNVALDPNQLIPQNDEMGSVKMTIQKFYRVNGGATQLRGVTPDIILPDRYDYLKYREKDNPSCLRWDEISKANYTEWTGSPSVPALLNKTNGQPHSSPAFVQIRQVIQTIDSLSQKPYSLNLETFRKDQKRIKELFKLLDEYAKLKEPLSVGNIPSDKIDIEASGDADKKEKNTQWLKIRSTDVYIQEALRTIESMIE